MNSSSIINIQITHGACLLRIQLSYRRERERDMFATQKLTCFTMICRGVNSVNTSCFSRYTNHSQGLLAADSSVVLEREWEKDVCHIETETHIVHAKVVTCL